MKSRPWQTDAHKRGLKFGNLRRRGVSGKGTSFLFRGLLTLSSCELIHWLYLFTMCLLLPCPFSHKTPSPCPFTHKTPSPLSPCPLLLCPPSHKMQLSLVRVPLCKGVFATAPLTSPLVLAQYQLQEVQPCSLDTAQIHRTAAKCQAVLRVLALGSGAASRRAPSTPGPCTTRRRTPGHSPSG